MAETKSSRKPVLIFGGSGALGSALAAKFRERGHDVLIPKRVDCDLKSAGTWLPYLKSLPEIEICVFAAGHSEAGVLDDVPSIALENCMNVNFLSIVTALKFLNAKGTRKFITIQSGAGDVFAPGLAPYALSKRALRDFFRFRRLDKAFASSQILEIWPGAIDSNFNQKTVIHGSYRLPRGSRPRPASEIADQILDALDAGRSKLVLNRLPLVIGKLQELCPGLVGWLLARR